MERIKRGFNGKMSMFNPLPAVDALHQNAAFWLDVSDKIIKFGALIVGGVWTWINFKRSRTYAQKLELQLAGSLFLKGDLYIDVDVVLRNVGASRHIVQATGTYCEIVAILTDLSEDVIRVFPSSPCTARLNQESRSMTTSFGELILRWST